MLKTCTMNVAATPGGVLKSKISKALEEVRGPDGGKTKVIGRGGKPIFAGIEARDPCPKQGCAYEEGCLVRDGSDCSQVNACYEISCLTCEEGDEEGEVQLPTSPRARWVAGRRRRGVKKVYIGNTGQSLHGRAIQHIGGLRRVDEGNPLHKHYIEEHMNTHTPKFEMKILTKHRTNLHRLITEGISI